MMRLTMRVKSDSDRRREPRRLLAYRDRSHTEVPALLSQPDDLATLLFTCVGVPEYASRAGGGPGAPVEIRPVAERFKDE
jgi:hypothetical protein